RPAQIQTLLAAFNSTNQAGAAVSGIIAAGVLPAAIEMMDNLAIQAAEAAVHAGYPDCGGLLLVELDGPAAEVAALMAQVREICTSCGAWELRVAQSEEQRAAVWKGRKAAFAAMGRISPNYIVQDGVIPRTALPERGKAGPLPAASARDGGDRAALLTRGEARVVEPGSVDEVATLLRDASRDGLAVIPRGGGTKLDWGRPPQRANLVLSTTRLDRVLEHAWA